MSAILTAALPLLLALQAPAPGVPRSTDISSNLLVCQVVSMRELHFHRLHAVFCADGAEYVATGEASVAGAILRSNGTVTCRITGRAYAATRCLSIDACGSPLGSVCR